MRTDWVRLRRLWPHTDIAGEMFDGLPADVWQVHLLQLKTSWSQRDHALIRKMARHWTGQQRQRYEQRWNWGRPARWR